MTNNVHPTESGASVLKTACEDEAATKYLDMLSRCPTQTGAGTVIAYEGKLFGTIISEDEFLALTAEQLRRIIIDQNRQVVRRPDGSLATFNPEWLSASPDWSYYKRD